MARKPETIFVQIASYRDPDLLNTLKDILNKAKSPQNLRFGIAWQHHKDDEWDKLDDYIDDDRFRILDIPSEESRGACWARNLLQQLYEGEKYTLQIDSHTRFIKNWDLELKKEYKRLLKNGIEKPLLTSYAPSFEPDNDPKQRVDKPWKMDFDRFSPDGNVHFLPSTIDDFKDRSEPIPARFYSAHFAFADGKFVDEVPHDPEYYFHGEEISIAVRAYTHGYELLHPHKIFLWHYYTRRGLKKHWDDHNDWGGINDGSQNEEEYQNSFSTPFKHCIDISFDSVPHDDYNVWAVAFEDESGNEIYRDDAGTDEIKRMMTDPDRFCRLWRSFNTVSRPYKWIVWPHSEKEGWVNRMEGVLYEKA